MISRRGCPLVNLSWPRRRLLAPLSVTSTHFTRRISIGAGVVLGGFSGLIVGNIIGSRINTDVWLEAPQNWVVQYSESGSTTPEASARVMGCLSPDTDTR